MTKDLTYHLSLDYDIMITRREHDGEVMYKAFTRELNPSEFYGVGYTKEEALQSFNKIKDELIPFYLEEGRDIPEPIREDAAMPSGKFVLRVGKLLHRQLVISADNNGKSLNAFTCDILTAHIAGLDLLDSLKRMLIERFSRRRVMFPIVSIPAPDGANSPYGNISYSTEQLGDAA